MTCDMEKVVSWDVIWINVDEMNRMRLGSGEKWKERTGESPQVDGREKERMG